MARTLRGLRRPLRSLHLHRAAGALPGLGLPARSAQGGPSYAAWGVWPPQEGRRRNDRASPQAPGRPDESGSSRQAVRGAPSAHAQSRPAAPHVPALRAAQRPLLHGPLSVQQARETVWRRLGSCGNLQKTVRTLWSQRRELTSPPPRKGKRGSMQGLWPACKVTQCVPDTSPEPISAHTKGPGGTKRALPCTPGLPTGDAPARRQCPRCLRHQLSSYQPPQTTCTHSPDRARFYIRPLLQNWQRQLPCFPENKT